MKKIVLCSLLFICNLTIAPLLACPTCIGRLEKDTPPIFSPEYDKRFWPESSIAKDTRTQTKSPSEDKMISLQKGKQS